MQFLLDNNGQLYQTNGTDTKLIESLNEQKVISFDIGMSKRNEFELLIAGCENGCVIILNNTLQI